TRIANMTLQEGNAGVDAGGGIYLTATAQPLLQDLLLFANSANWGGGIFANSAITLDNVTLSGNTAAGYDGGGMFAFGPVVATNSVFKNNTVITGGFGGGLSTW